MVHDVVSRNNYKEWLVSTVYVSSNRIFHKHLFDNLLAVASSGDFSWLIAGNFNDYMDSSERVSLNDTTNSSSNRCIAIFLDYVDRCNLVDLGANGPRLTWSNGRDGMAMTFVRLDIAIASPDWRLLFPKTSVTAYCLLIQKV